MNQKQLTAEIIPAEKLPGDLRYELSLSPDHIVRLDGYTYLSMGEKTAVFPDNPDTDALLSSLINGSKVLDRPASASGLFQRMLTDAQFTPDAELYKACRVKDKQKRSVVVFRGSGTSGKDLYTLLSQIAPVEKNDIVFTVTKTDMADTVGTLEQLKNEIGFARVDVEANVAKVSIVGAGMLGNPGVAARMFGALASENINLDVISTSEITISCLIAKEDEKKAVNVVHRFFFPNEEK